MIVKKQFGVNKKLICAEKLLKESVVFFNGNFHKIGLNNFTYRYSSGKWTKSNKTRDEVNNAIIKALKYTLQINRLASEAKAKGNRRFHIGETSYTVNADYRDLMD